MTTVYIYKINIKKSKIPKTLKLPKHVYHQYPENKKPNMFYHPKIDIKNNEEDKETFGKFSDIFFDHYESDNQITFFVPIDEEQYTLDELTDILI